MDGRAVVVVLWAVAMGGAMGVPLGLSCTLKDRSFYYRIRCTGTPNQTVLLTKEVIDDRIPKNPKFNVVVVLVKSVATLLVTEGFLQRWSQFNVCRLEVSSVADLRFPDLTTSLPGPLTPENFSTAGLWLKDVSVDTIPAGLFSGRERAGLRLTRCSVGRIPSGVLQGARLLRLLQILQSSVVLFEGPLGPEELDYHEFRPVEIEDSTLGQLGEGALHLTTNTPAELLLKDVTLGEVSAGAVNLSGPARLVLEGCKVMHLDQLALTLHGKAILNITKSTVMAEPGALSGLACSSHGHHINSSRVFVLAQAGGQGHTDIPSLANQTQDLDQQPSRREVQQTVLHPTCVECNILVTVLSQPKLPQRRSEHWLRWVGLYCFMGANVLLIVWMVAMGWIMMHEPPYPPISQVVVMRHSPEDPMNEPPPTALLARPGPPAAVGHGPPARKPPVTKVAKTN